MAFLCIISGLTISSSQDVGLANAPRRMVGGCFATVQHQETIHMTVNKVYAVLAKKSTLIIVVLSTVITVLGLAALVIGGSVEFNISLTALGFKAIGK